MWNEEPLGTAMSADVDLAQFFERVRKLWPGYKCTVDSIRGVWERNRGHPIDSVLGALSEMRFLDPDATKPIWAGFGRLVAKDKQRGVVGAGNGFDNDSMHRPGLLQRLRVSMRDSGWGARANELSNEAVWDAHVRACTGDVRYASNDDGTRRVEWIVNADRHNAYTQEWIDYHTARGFPVPAYLQLRPVDRHDWNTCPCKKCEAFRKIKGGAAIPLPAGDMVPF